MRVAIVVKSLKIGGMERAAINLAETFANEGHQSHLIYFKQKGRKLSPNEHVNVHLFELEKLLKYTVIGLFLNIFSKILNGLIRHSYFYWQGLLLSPIFNYKIKQLEKEYGTFDLIIIRGQGTFEMIWPYNNKRLILQQVNILRNYDISLGDFFRRAIFSNKQVLCNAQSVYNELSSDFKKSNVKLQSLHVISSPINPQLIQKRSHEYEIDFKDRFIVNIGRLAPVKNIELLIDSYAFARENLGLQHKLVIVGDGNLRNALEKQGTNLGIEEHIHFTGALINPYPWLRKAELFAFTSKNEGLPNVLLEALACETKIISTKGRGGTLDIMSGELESKLTNFDKREVASMIMSELNTTETIDYKKHLRKYTPSSVVKEYINIYCQ